MRAVMIVSLIAVIVLSMSTLGLRAEKKAQLHHLIGEVVSMDAVAKSLIIKETLKDGKTQEVAFTVDETTKVTIQGKAGKLEELKTADPVKVGYHKMGTANHAVVVESWTN